MLSVVRQVIETDFSPRMESSDVDLLQQGTYLGHMGRHTPSTAADIFAEAAEARQAAGREMENWRAHLAALESATTPDHREALQHQVDRSARIVQAEMNRAQEKSREANRLQDAEQDQLRSVS
jgi:hypothetical protein